MERGGGGGAVVRVMDGATATVDGTAAVGGSAGDVDRDSGLV